MRLGRPNGRPMAWVRQWGAIVFCAIMAVGLAVVAFVVW